jgi:hypothetical protein
MTAPVRLKFFDGPSDTRCADATGPAPQGDELGDLVATYPPGHVAQFASDGSLNVYRKPCAPANTAVNDLRLYSAPLMERCGPDIPMRLGK